jgi:hypothetical protein
MLIISRDQGFSNCYPALRSSDLIMKLAVIPFAAFLLSGCAVKSGGAALLPSRTEVVFQHCLVTARDDDGKALFLPMSQVDLGDGRQDQEGGRAVHGVTCRHGVKSARRASGGRAKCSPGSASAWRGMNPAFTAQPADLILSFLLDEDESAAECWKSAVN